MRNIIATYIVYSLPERSFPLGVHKHDNGQALDIYSSCYIYIQGENDGRFMFVVRELLQGNQSLRLKQTWRI